MRRTNFIEFDVHSTFCEGGYIDGAGREKRAWQELTAIPELLKAIESVPRPRKPVIEEGRLRIGCIAIFRRAWTRWLCAIRTAMR